MLFHQLLAVTIYSCWHYGKVYHESKRRNITLQQAAIQLSFVLLMVYLLYSNAILFFAITFSKFIYDLFLIIVAPSPAYIFHKNKENMFDAMIGLACCVLYTVG
tara:strand:- start:864 stop:1175 length:312 start_codon:yes stop_codon:yes gene_type:complete